MNARAIAFASLLSVLVPAAASAENSASLRIASSYIPNSGYDAMWDSNNLLQAEFNYAHTLMPLWRGKLWLEGSYAIGARKSELFGGDFDTSLVVQHLTVGARYTMPIYDWLVPQARLGLGLVVGGFSLDPRGDDQPKVSDFSAAFAGHLLAGVELLLPRRWTSTRFTGGLIFEAGYTFSTRMGFNLEPDEDDHEQRIKVVPAEVGGLVLTGFQFRIGGVFRF